MIHFRNSQIVSREGAKAAKKRMQAGRGSRSGLFTLHLGET